MALFVVTSEPEQKIIEKYFGYDKEEVIVTGFSRWDVLEDRSDPAHKEILLMPTWRNWLEDISEEAFRKSEYYLYSNRFFQKPDEVEFQKLIQTVKDNPAEYKQISA